MDATMCEEGNDGCNTAQKAYWYSFLITILC
jgi:hypothetical protein